LAGRPPRPLHPDAALRLAIDPVENFLDRPQIAGERQIDELARDQLRQRDLAAVGRLGWARQLHQQNFPQLVSGATGVPERCVAHP
jgi:hypothetical protein